ncbi:uncharacterized protein LOC115626628 [Scaptodrosophila lebanonensis]|uniref:Uncharacterized protein LOC115626628 n=1 Tax=Drosophila lebanonensis TaxID=7225 RepID=A0A6J2TSJ7_DROLE|nr:uncharacterized protein LOC115626628 [Scaptodrosophila lebanonensis]
MPAVIFMHSVKCTKNIWQLARAAHQSNYKPPLTLFITATVRTAVPLEQDQTGAVVDDLIKRATVPRTEIQKLIVCTTPAVMQIIDLSRLASDLGLKGCESHTFEDKDVCSTSGLQLALDSLRKDPNNCVILSDIRHQKADNEGDLRTSPSELMSLLPQPRRRKQPQSDDKPLAPSLDAAAISLATNFMSKRLQLQPLASIRNVTVEKDVKLALLQLCQQQGIKPNELHSLELVTLQKRTPQELDWLTELNLQKIAIHDANKVTTTHLLTHLSHKLPNGAYGCITIEMLDENYLLLLLEKLIPRSIEANKLPQLTLYTKVPCPLCDELVEQLEQHFAGEYILQKVYIDRKENVRFLRLFRYDIPVLFLNGQFLCMHRLNENLLRERLAQLKESREQEVA